MDVIPHLSAWRRLWSTLRFRWACWTALVVIATALATLLGLRQGVQWALLREMDLILMEDAREIELMVSAIPAEGMDAIVEMLDRKAVGHEQHDWFVQFVDRQGTLIWASQRAPQDVIIHLTVRVSARRSLPRRTDAKSICRHRTSRRTLIRFASALLWSYYRSIWLELIDS